MPSSMKSMNALSKVSFIAGGPQHQMRYISAMSCLSISSLIKSLSHKRLFFLSIFSLTTSLKL